jgi:PKD repeat protein
MLVLFFLVACAGVIPCVTADTTDHTPMMFRADPWHSGVNDDGGTRPSGVLQWSFPTGDRVYSSPAVVDGIAYIGSDDDTVYALNEETGVEIWSYPSGGRILSSPAVGDGVVYVGSYDRNLYALDKDTGTLLWDFPTEGSVTSSPVVTDGVVYSGSLDDKLYALDALTGDEIWNASFGEYPSIDSSPAVAGGILYVTGGQVTLYALDASDGREVWNFTTGNPISSSPSVAEGIVYVSSWDGNVYALDALTGEEIWNYTIGIESEMDSSPAVADGVVYIGSNDHNVYALDALTGDKIWNYTTGSVVYSSPTVANGVVYVGSWDGKMYALDTETGEKIWDYTTGSVVYSSPAVAGGLVFFGSFDGNVYALGSAPDLGPVANFTANETFGFIPLDIRFTDLSTGAQPLVYQWDFGDGSPNATIQNPVHTYTTIGTYNVTLTVSNSAGTNSYEQPWYIHAMDFLPPVGGDKAYYLVHSNVDGAEVYFNGDWFEGTIENGTLLVQTCTSCTPVWTYTVKECGYFTLTQNNTRYPAKDEVVDLWANLTAPKEPLIADFTANTTNGPSPLTVEFESHSVGIAQAWNWSFGDGTYSEEEDPVHTYASPGSYTVSLQETNTACQNSTMVKPDYITVGEQPLFKADFSVTPVTGDAPLTIYCSDKSIGNPTMIVYNFGDGFTAVGSDVAHTYRFPGTYTISETISKYDFTTRTFLTSVARKPNAITVIRALTPPPEAAFTASPTNGASPLTVAFTDESSGNPTYYSYDFGDGFKATTPNPVHVYRFPGMYEVKLTILRISSDFASLQSAVATGTITVNAA